MTAFDGRNGKVSVFFDSDGEEINVALSGDIKDYASQGEYLDEVMALTPDEAAELVQDLMTAIIVRGRPDIYRDVLVDFGVLCTAQR